MPAAAPSPQHAAGFSLRATVSHTRLWPFLFQRVGAAALKKDLTNTYKLCEVAGNPQDKVRFVHIAGTNGKGSSAHLTASILQEAGYKTGLYTSPHLKSFTERIRINGKEV